MLKRKKPSSPVDEFRHSFQSAHFLEMRHADSSKTLSTVSPFLIEKSIRMAVKGDLKTVKKLKNGTVLIETATSEQSMELLKLSSLGNVVPIAVQPHSSLNTGRGVIRCWELEGMSNEDICDALSSQGVLGVKCLTKTQTKRFPPTYLLTFPTSNVPETVSILYQKYKVDTYYPQPLRCYQCQTYGHGTPCSRPAVCPKCAQPITDKHTEETCCNPLRCAACKVDGHEVRSKTCPRYLEECQVIKVSQSQKITVPDARKSIKNGSQTYASATASQSLFPPLPSRVDSPPLSFASQKESKNYWSPTGVPSNISLGSQSFTTNAGSPFSLTPKPLTNSAPTVAFTKNVQAKQGNLVTCSGCETLLPAISQLTAQVSALTEIIKNLLQNQFNIPTQILDAPKTNKNKKKQTSTNKITPEETNIKIKATPTRATKPMYVTPVDCLTDDAIPETHSLITESSTIERPIAEENMILEDFNCLPFTNELP